MSIANPKQDFSNKLNEDKDIHAERALAESSKEDEDESSEVEEAEKYFNNRWERPGQRLVRSIEIINMSVISTALKKRCRQRSSSPTKLLRKRRMPGSKEQTT